MKDSLRILVVHNTYRGPGGEDVVARRETALLRSHGHSVMEYWRSNAEYSGLDIAKVPLHAVYSCKTHREIRERTRQFSPDLIHVHNWWMAVSPSVFWVADSLGVPVVQTLHNYRLLCLNGLFLRDGKPCELCKTKRMATPGLRYRCYRNSLAQSGLLAATVAVHRSLGTWAQKVDRYIALTDFARTRFEEGGIPSDKIRVKPNFVDLDLGISTKLGRYAIYVGRLSEEKGIRVLLEAWQTLRGIPLKIVGDGPLLEEASVLERQIADVEVLGWKSPARVMRLIRDSRLLVFPSLSYEGLPLAIVEAFACGIPVVASQLGAMASMVEDGTTGVHVAPGDARDLAEKVQTAWNDPDALTRMAANARREYEVLYSPKVNYEKLAEIYAEVLQ